jgi:hypothetical protein
MPQKQLSKSAVLWMGPLLPLPSSIVQCFEYLEKIFATYLAGPAAGAEKYVVFSTAQCRVDDQHQNDKAEKASQTVVYMASHSMIHHLKTIPDTGGLFFKVSPQVVNTVKTKCSTDVVIEMQLSPLWWLLNRWFGIHCCKHHSTNNEP